MAPAIAAAGAGVAQQTSAKVPEAAEALYSVIARYGNQCLSQASLRTGYGIHALEDALEYLVAKGAVQPVPNQGQRQREFLSYRVAR